MANAFEIQHRLTILKRLLGSKGKNSIQLNANGCSLQLSEEDFFCVVSQYVERVELEGLSRLDFAEEKAIPVLWCSFHMEPHERAVSPNCKLVKEAAPLEE